MFDTNAYVRLINNVDHIKYDSSRVIYYKIEASIKTFSHHIRRSVLVTCVLQGRNLEDIPRYNEISDRVNLSCENVHAGIQLLETRTNRLFRKNLEIFPGNDAGVRCFIDFCYNRLPHVMNFPILSGKVFSKVRNHHN